MAAPTVIFVEGTGMVKVYIASAAAAGAVGPVWPAARQAQLDKTKNACHRQARYGVWRLLEYALRDALGLELRQLELSLNEGKWTCPECFFSLSHSKNAVAVAVATEPVGVDVEYVRPLSASLAEKILSEEELTAFRGLSPENGQAYLLDRWCKKESLFKWGHLPAYRPRELCPGDMTRTATFRLAGQQYTVAVTACDPQPPQFHIT